MNQLLSLCEQLRSVLPNEYFEKLYIRHKAVLDSQIRLVTITTQRGATRKFWVYQNRFVTCGLSTLSSVVVYPNIRRFIREFNLMFHPDKYSGPDIDGLPELLSNVNHDPSIEAINDLLNILAMPINAKSAPSRDDRNLFNIRLCDNLSDMFRTCEQRTIGLSFFHLPLIRQLVTDEFNRHTAAIFKGAEPVFKTLCVAIFKDFEPKHCHKLKWASRATSVPSVSTSISCILRLIHAVHRTMAVSDDWVQFVKVSLTEAHDDALAAAPVTMVDDDEVRGVPDAPKYKALRPANINIPPRRRVTRSMAAPRRSKRLCV